MILHPNQVAGRNEIVGGSFEPFITEHRQQARLGYEIADGIGDAAFAVATIGNALPALSAAAATGTFVGKGIASSGYDAISQYATNGGNLNQINYSEVGVSFLIQGEVRKRY